jgi:hypothetical protein
MFYHQVKVSVKDGDSYYPGYAWGVTKWQQSIGDAHPQYPYEYWECAEESFDGSRLGVNKEWLSS